MSNPSVTSVTFDKANYNGGDLITVTVSYVKGATNGVPDITDVSVGDGKVHAWTKVAGSDTGSSVQFQAVA